MLTGSSATSREGFRDQGARNRNALGLAAGKFIGIATAHLGQRQAYRLQRLFDDAFETFARRRHLEIACGLIEITVDALKWAEGGERILKNGLHFFQEPVPPFLVCQVQDIPALVVHVAGSRVLKTQHEARQGRLAAATLTGKGVDFRPVVANGEAGSCHRLKTCGGKAFACDENA